MPWISSGVSFSHSSRHATFSAIRFNIAPRDLGRCFNMIWTGFRGVFMYLFKSRGSLVRKIPVPSSLRRGSTVLRKTAQSVGGLQDNYKLQLSFEVFLKQHHIRRETFDGNVSICSPPCVAGKRISATFDEIVAPKRPVTKTFDESVPG